MAWYWHIWWGLICLYSAWRIGDAIAMSAIAQVNIEKERNRRSDLKK